MLFKGRETQSRVDLSWMEAPVIRPLSGPPVFGETAADRRPSACLTPMTLGLGQLLEFLVAFYCIEDEPVRWLFL